MIPTTADQKSTDTDLIVEIKDLRVQASTRRGEITIVNGLSMAIGRGEVRAIVGESGSGKSTVCLAVLRLLADNARIESGTISVDGTRVESLDEKRMRAVRGRTIGAVFQDPLSSLDPVRRIGTQLAEARVLHGLSDRRSARRWSLNFLASLGFDDPERAARSFPNQLSGGMRQRVCVGIAFSAEPRLVVADEPTTALDVSLQGRLLRLLLEQRKQYNTSVLLVSHDVAVVRSVADRVTVMFGGEALEEGATSEVFGAPRSPYTRALLGSIPSIEPHARGRRLATIPTVTQAPTTGGCPFAGRCQNEIPVCRTASPPRIPITATHYVRCFNPEGGSHARQ